MKKTNNRVLVLYFHSAASRSRANAAMIEALDGLDNVTIRNMYEIYPDFNIDVKTEQELLDSHDIIVWQHPVHWYSAPPLLKHWMDQVFAYGYAYGPGGDALRDKTVLSAVTTGGTRESYAPGQVHRFSLTEFLRPIEQTAVFCKMEYMAPFVIHNSLGLDNNEIGTQAKRYRQVITRLRDGLFNGEAHGTDRYMNQLIR